MTPRLGIVVSLMAVALTVGSADTPPQITPFGFLYALHDALVRPLRRGSHGQQPGRVLDGEPGWAGV
jgi:hypothetical protein